MRRANGSYMGVIMSEVLYQTPKKDYFCDAEPCINDHFACEAKPSKGKIEYPRVQRVQASYFNKSKQLRMKIYDELSKNYEKAGITKNGIDTFKNWLS